jgi:cobalt-precorrin-5B (C1)-methyltransferase
MTSEYIVIHGKRYRKGFTTGSCAAAAVKAAVHMLVSGQVIESVTINTPTGIRLELPVQDMVVTERLASCAVVKDGGDDVDCTTGLKICASACHNSTPGVTVLAGEGIGTVTNNGLRVPVGQPAINPVPMRMIREAAGEMLPEGTGVTVTLSVPGGEEAARHTLNERLGIVGGISILGTTGIVTPMSEESWKEALAVELSVTAARDAHAVTFVFGNYGKKFAREQLQIDDLHIVTISNFLGFMLERAAELQFDSVLLVGHIGKLVKPAAGIFHTHSHVADARQEIICAYAALEGAPREIVQQLYACSTTDAAAEIIDACGLTAIYKRIVENAARRCSEHVDGAIKVGTVMFGYTDTPLAMDGTGASIIQELRGSLPPRLQKRNP